MANLVLEIYGHPLITYFQEKKNRIKNFVARVRVFFMKKTVTFFFAKKRKQGFWAKLTFCELVLIIFLPNLLWMLKEKIQMRKIEYLKTYPGVIGELCSIQT